MGALQISDMIRYDMTLCRGVTDEQMEGRTDGQTTTAYNAHLQHSSRGKNEFRANDE